MCLLSLHSCQNSKVMGNNAHPSVLYFSTKLQSGTNPLSDQQVDMPFMKQYNVLTPQQRI